MKVTDIIIKFMGKSGFYLKTGFFMNICLTLARLSFFIPGNVLSWVMCQSVGAPP